MIPNLPSADVLEDRRRTARLAMALHEIDAMLISDEANVRYLTGFTGDSSVLLLETNGATMISDGRYQTQLRDECFGLATFIRSPTMPMPQAIAEVISGLPGIIGIESADMTVSVFESINDSIGRQASESNTRLKPVKDFLVAARGCKDEGEIAIIEKAVEVAQDSFKAILHRFDCEWTEQQLAWELEGEMRSRGASGVSFPIIAASGPASALPHYSPKPSKISDSPVLLVDWGARVDGYVSDLTRMLWLDEAGPDDDFAAAHAAVDAAVDAAIEKIRPGQSVRVVDEAARSVLRAVGMEEAFLHSLGHGIGLEVHEGPRISSAGDDQTAPVLREGMIVTIEPGVYFADRYGIRLEEDVLVTEDGCRPLSTLPRGLVDLRAMM